MEYIYEYNGNKLTLDEFKADIINDYVNTNKLKKDLLMKYPISSKTLAKVLNGVVKTYCECTSCGVKDNDLFYPKRKTICKNCLSDKNKSFYSDLSDDVKKDKIRKQTKWVNNNIIRFRVLAAKNRSIRKNLAFDIDDEFINNLLIKQNNKCKYSNVTLELKTGSDDLTFNPNTLSIDRIDSKLGYIKSNVVLVTAIVNTMKNGLSEDDFLKTISLIHGSKN